MRDGITQLYRRELDQLDAVAIAGTENGDGPFFSPGGEWLAFDSDGVLKKVSLRGGPATTTCALPGAFRHATWTADDTIIFGVEGSGLLQVPGAGGEPRPFLDLEEGEMDHGFPDVLPGGRAVLFRSRRGSARVVVVHSLETGERRDLVDGVSPLYVPTGHLVFGRAGSLWAAPFDLDALDFSGEPVPILEGVVMGNESGGPGPPAQAAFTSTGSLVYVSGDPRSGLGRTLVWVDREGHETALPFPARDYRRPRLSPDERSLVRRAPPRIGRRAASDAGVEAAWALCLLRAYGERPEPVGVRLPCRPHLAEVAQPAVTEAGNAVDTVPPSPGVLPASADDGDALNCPRVAKPSVEEPDAAEPARPDLWGAGVSNDPGLPDVRQAWRAAPCLALSTGRRKPTGK